MYGHVIVDPIDDRLVVIDPRTTPKSVQTLQTALHAKTREVWFESRRPAADKAE